MRPVFCPGREQAANKYKVEKLPAARYLLSAMIFVAYLAKKNMKEQNFKNHTRLVPGYHGFTYILLATALAFSFSMLFKAINNKVDAKLPITLVLLCFVILFISLYCRSFALKAQDRAIRAEENFRHFILTGSPLDKRLRMGQIIALRFAPDAEFVALAKRAVDETLDSKTIKMSIQNWRADHHRA